LALAEARTQALAELDHKAALQVFQAPLHLQRLPLLAAALAAVLTGLLALLLAVLVVLAAADVMAEVVELEQLLQCRATTAADLYLLPIMDAAAVVV
jgi:uncharacterized membrane protein